VIEIDAQGEAPMSMQEKQGSVSGVMPLRFGLSLLPRNTRNPPCPTCERRLIVKQATPVLFASGLDDVIYGCEKCGTETKLAVKRT
jgi:hypothetical protein